MLTRAQVAKQILNESISGPEKGEPKGTYHLKAANWEVDEALGREHRSDRLSEGTFPSLAEKVVNKRQIGNLQR